MQIMFEKAIAKLEEDLKELNRRLTVDIPRELHDAAALGDLSENAEYVAAKEKKNITETRVSQLTKRIQDLRKIDLSKISIAGVGLGSLVTIEDLDTGEEITWEMVLADQVDVDAGRISIQAPIGKALMGKEEGDEVTVILPKGKREFLLNKLVTIHQRDI